MSGERGALCRQTVRGHSAEGGGEFEVELFSVSTTDDGLITYLEIFDGTGLDAAFDRFEEIGAVTEPERVARPLCAVLINARDWDALARLLHRGLRARRPPRPRMGDAARDRRDAGDVSARGTRPCPDLEDRVEVLAERRRSTARCASDGYGHAADGGGAMEYFLTTGHDDPRRPAAGGGAVRRGRRGGRAGPLRGAAACASAARTARRRCASSRIATSTSSTPATGTRCAGSTPPTCGSSTGA